MSCLLLSCCRKGKSWQGKSLCSPFLNCVQSFAAPTVFPSLHTSGNTSHPSQPLLYNTAPVIVTLQEIWPMLTSQSCMQVNGLPVFYKQRMRGLYPSWAYTAPGTYLRVYYSATEALIWSCIVYWLVGFAPDAGRQASLSCCCRQRCFPPSALRI